jgi:hypothetical protein
MDGLILRPPKLAVGTCRGHMCLEWPELCKDGLPVLNAAISHISGPSQAAAQTEKAVVYKNIFSALILLFLPLQKAYMNAS